MTTEEIDERIDMKLGILLEHIDDRFTALLENIDVMIERKVRPIVQEELVEIKNDTEAIKLAVKETNRVVQKLKLKVNQS
jgi:hypothetical protein